MIRCGDQVRLSEKDKDELELMGWARPENVQTIQDLRAFIDRRLVELASLHARAALTPEARLLALLLEDKRRELGD